MNDFQIGDRVIVNEDTHFYAPIAAGTMGVVTFASWVSHATANGGGFDIGVKLDDGRKVILRSTQLRRPIADRLARGEKLGR